MSTDAGLLTGRVLRSLTIALACCCLGVLAWGASSASAAPEWGSEMFWGPTEFQAGEPALVTIQPHNKGDSPTDDVAQLEFNLPPGASLTNYDGHGTWFCQLPDFPENVCLALPGFGPVAQTPRLDLFLDVAPGASGTFPLSITISGGGDPTPHTETSQVTIDDTPLGFGAKPGTVRAGAFDESGADFTQAGGHPFAAEASFDFNIDHQALQAGGIVKDTVVEAPAGLAGDPTAVPTCTDAQLTANDCPPESQVGLIRIYLFGLSKNQVSAIYNMEAPGHLPAQFGFVFDAYTMKINPTVRTDDDYGITATTPNTPEDFVVGRARAILWGVPADPAHDHQRCPMLNSVAMSCTGTDSDGQPQPPEESTPTSSSAPLKPFLSNPTSCVGPLQTLLHFSSWENRPNDFTDFDFSDPLWANFTAPNPAVTGCDQVDFDPTLTIQPKTKVAGQPTGLDVDLDLPQNDDPDGLATSHLKKTTVTLPEGMTVSPSSADGLQACTRAQTGLTTPVGTTPARFSKAPVGCPDGSKLATAVVTSPALEDPLSGAVYLAEQDLNPFSSMVAMYLVAKHPSTLVKLAGKVDLDPDTGRITATFDDNPQLPVSEVKLDFPDGPRASLTVPAKCGSHQVGWSMDGWSGAQRSGADGFVSECPAGVDPAAPLPFAPSFTAGTTNPAGGSHSPFVLRIQRGDRQQELSGVKVEMPTGLAAKLAGVPLCGEAQAAAGTCGQGSRIGTATAGAGPGPNPFYVSGPVYLTGPYKGAPYGLSVAVPAVAGPFDLGTVVVRSALHVDRSDAHATTISDPLPRILKGVPLQIRDIRVAVDRPDFIVNPTSCAQKQITSTISSTQGAASDLTEAFRASNCARLSFKPKLKLALTGKRQRTTGRHPGVKAQVTQRPGEAATKQAVVKLPKSLALDPDNAQALCEFSDGTKPDLENHCPKGSIVGRAKAVTPLLDEPLAGNVYFVKNVRTDPKTGNQIRTLPMIVVALRGKIAINLRGESSVSKSRLVNTFASVPDAPITRFNLNIKGGANGILAVTRTRRGRINICNSRQSAETDFDAQNGRAHDRNIRITTPCKNKKAKQGKAKRAKRQARKR